MNRQKAIDDFDESGVSAMSRAGGIRREIWPVSAVINLVAALVLAAGISGCASFKEIRTFASLSHNAARNDALIRDYIGTLDRRKQYQSEKFHGELEAQKMRRQAQQAALGLLQETMSDYMDSLAALASGDIRPYDRSLKDFSSSLTEAALLTGDEKQAAGALSTLAARALTAAYRLGEIRSLIRDAEAPLQDVIGATRRIVEKGIVADLQVEVALVGRYYDNFMLAPDNPAEPVAMALAKQARAEALDRVDSRIRIAQNYGVVLEKIAQGHRFLYENKDAIGGDEFNGRLRRHTDELRSAYRKLIEVSR